MAYIHDPEHAAAPLADGEEPFAAEAGPAPRAAPAADYHRGAWQRLRTGMRLLGSQPLAIIGLVILSIHVLMAICGSLVAPYPATDFHLEDKLQGPSATYLFGTDQFGRDIFSRVLVGARSILLLSTVSTAFGLLLGVTVGLVAGYAGGQFDELLMRLMDALMAFPALLLSLLVLTMLGPATQNVVLAIGLVFMPSVARVVRSVALSLRTMQYVDAARVRGESSFYIMTREVLPNAIAPIVVEGAIRVSYAILLAASLGFLGLGIQPPHPDWGLMVSEARHFIGFAPWMVLFPALGIASLVIGTNLSADGLTRALETGQR